MQAQTPIIQTQNLSRRFGDIVAVRDISLTVYQGEIFGMLGPNGAGKSTLLRMLCGILDPSSGSGSVVGCDIGRQPEKIKERISYMAQRFGLYEDLTVSENLHFYAGIYGLSRAQRRSRVGELLESAGLKERRDQLSGTLSGGWKQRLALACATIHKPPLLFLDEPTAGVDPVSRREFWEQIHAAASNGTTILLTTHYMDEAERCHRLAFIFRGSLYDIGTPKEILGRRGLRIAELEVSDAPRAAEILRKISIIEEVGHYGGVLRVSTRRNEDPCELSAKALSASGVQVLSNHEVRPNVEDAFVSMVREDKP
jgi:ABC-2 type transport system ATP-binding protein